MPGAVVAIHVAAGDGDGVGADVGVSHSRSTPTWRLGKGEGGWTSDMFTGPSRFVERLAVERESLEGLVLRLTGDAP